MYFRAYLAVLLLMLAAVPAQAADVKELFAIGLADYPGKEGRVLEVSYGPTDVHVVGRNTSKTERAGFVVVLLKGIGALSHGL